jgi:hypothetical protein
LYYFCIPISAFLLVWPVFHSHPLLFRCLFVGQWDFRLYMHCAKVNVTTLRCTSVLTQHPHPVLFNSFHHVSCILFLHRCDTFHYYSLCFLFLVSSTSPTFGCMLCIYFYVYIKLLVFVLSLYSTYERKHVAFGFLNLANLT